jgi:hypothetical protein
MTEVATEMERATTNAEQMAHSLGVRVFLYRDLTGRPVFRTMHPAGRDEHLELIRTFEPPAPTKYEGALPSSP